MIARASPRWTAPLLAVLLGASFPGTADGADKVPIAVIVHPKVPVDEVSLPELRRIFLGERHSWTENLTVTLLAPPRDSPERQVLLNEIYQRKSEVQYQQYWISRLFGDGPSVSPKNTGSQETAASLVRGLPGAIALARADRIPPGVKVLRIDGKRPGEAGYPLVASRP